MFVIEFMHDLMCHSQMLYAVLKFNKQQQNDVIATLNELIFCHLPLIIISAFNNVIRIRRPIILVVKQKIVQSLVSHSAI